MSCTAIQWWERQSCFLVAKQLWLQVAKLRDFMICPWEQADLVWGLVFGIFFCFFNCKHCDSSDFMCVSKLPALNNVSVHFRCQDEQGQKYCFFTVQKNAVVSLLLLKIAISTRYPTSNFAIAKSNMTRHPWKQFMKTNLYSPLVLKELCGETIFVCLFLVLFCFSFRVMYDPERNLVVLTKWTWSDVMGLQLLVYMRTLFFHVKSFLENSLQLKGNDYLPFQNDPPHVHFDSVWVIEKHAND